VDLIKKFPFNIAHRGASGVVPENSFIAFSTAIASKADMVEFDVQITKDEKLVLFHDNTLQRITGETEKISNFSLKDVDIQIEQMGNSLLYQLLFFQLGNST